MVDVEDFDALWSLYSGIYNAATKVLEEHNPCEIEEGGKCIDSDDGCCCKRCKHLGPDGCTVEALLCRLHLCRAAVKNCPDAAKELELLDLIARRYNLPIYFRASKEENFERLKKHLDNQRKAYYIGRMTSLSGTYLYGGGTKILAEKLGR
jgi:hypothetical protein